MFCPVALQVNDCASKAELGPRMTNRKLGIDMFWDPRATVVTLGGGDSNGQIFDHPTDNHKQTVARVVASAATVAEITSPKHRSEVTLMRDTIY